MSIGDRRYREIVPQESQIFAAEQGLGEPEWFIPGMEAASYYPESVRQFLAESARDLIAAGDTDPRLREDLRLLDDVQDARADGVDSRNGREETAR